MRRTYGVSPVSETDSLMVRCASSRDDDGDDNQTQETQDFNRCGDDFGFTKEADIQQVDSKNCDQTNSDDNCRCEVCPVTHYDCCGGHF
jgi:hypothetical protein